ncbi:MAG TPA: hypothetical protein PK826_04915 [Anaerolineae bacterium]|nr:hypothetical protein [Anaerolineae bacterium]
MPRPSFRKRRQQLGISGLLVFLIATLGAAGATGATAAAGTAGAGARPAAMQSQERPQQQPLPTATAWVPDGAWTAIHAPGKNPLWTGGPGHNAPVCGEAGTTVGQKGTTPALCGVHGVPDGQGDWLLWAVGENGMLARYSGGSWQKVDDLAPARTSPRTYHLHDVQVLSPTEVWAVGWVEGDSSCISEDGVCGAVLRYDGQRWQAQERSRMGISGCMARLNAIDMATDAQGTFGWVVGDRQCGNGGALYLKYDGSAWKWVRVPQASRDLHDVRIVNRGDVWAMGEFGIESHFFEPIASPAWSVLGKSGADDLFAVDLVDATFGWDGGVNGRLNRYIGACHDDDPGTQCWFDNQASPVQDQQGNKLTQEVYAIDLLSRSQGWLVGERDGRRSFIAHFFQQKRWKTLAVADDPGASLYGLFAPTLDWAVAVGDEGSIVAYRAAPSPTATASVPPTATASATVGATRTAASATPTATLTPPPSATAEGGATLSPSPTATTPATVPPPPTATGAPSPETTAAAGRLWLPLLFRTRPRSR